MFWMRNKKIIFSYALLFGGLPFLTIVVKGLTWEEVHTFPDKVDVLSELFQRL